MISVLPGGAAATAATDAARTGMNVGESKVMRIVVFCNTGERSGASSIGMTERLGIPVGAWWLLSG